MTRSTVMDRRPKLTTKTIEAWRSRYLMPKGGGVVAME